MIDGVFTQAFSRRLYPALFNLHRELSLHPSLKLNQVKEMMRRDYYGISPWTSKLLPNKYSLKLLEQLS
jgi:hypothetical protein